MEANNIPKLSSYKISKADFNEENEVYILEILSNNSFIKINSTTKQFIDEVDGIKSYSEIAKSFNEKYNTNLTDENIKNIINNKLAKHGLLEGTAYKKDRFLESRLWFHWNLMDGKKFENIANKFTFLFNPIVMICILLFETIFFISVLSDVNFINFMSKKSINYFQNINLFIIFIMLLFTSIFHEFGHIVASFRYNTKPRKVGIGLYLLMPVFFVDLSESWSLDRKKRCMIDLGGMYFQLLSILLYSPMILLNNSILNIINYKIIIYATLTNILFNLNPTLKMDGYWALSDLTGVVNIHFRTKKRIINRIRKILGLKVSQDNYSLTSNAKKIFTLWSILYTIITGLFIYIGISKLIALLNNNSINIELIIMGLTGYMLLRTLISILRNKLKK